MMYICILTARLI